MKKFLKNKRIHVTLVATFCLLLVAIPHPASADLFAFVGNTVADTILSLPAILSIVLLQILSLVLYLAGTILNFVLNYTVVHMADNIEGAGVNNAWGMIRDVANMGFIFILLYASIRTILGMGSDTQKLVVKVIVVAIMINFSLFATKLVIDASNVMAITFYDAIAPGMLEGTEDEMIRTGLASSIMQPLGIQTLAKEVSTLDGTKALTVGILGSVFVLVAAFVLFAISILFIIRFVVLIFVLILSPIAFLALTLPALQEHSKKWWNALSGQAFFAPIFFMLLWVVISISRNIFNGDGSLAAGLIGTTGTGADGKLIINPPDASDIGLIVNFIVVIALLIGALIIAKDWANKAGPGVKNLTKWATGAAGNAAFGGAGRLGRNTFGRVGAAVGDSETLKETAAKGGARGMAARLSLAAGRKTSKASFDLRGSPLGGPLEAGKAQKGGFEQTLKDTRKKEVDFTKSLGPSDTLISDAERAVEKAPAGSEERSLAELELDRIKGVKEKEAKERIKERMGLGDSKKDKEKLNEHLKSVEGKTMLESMQTKGLADQRKEARIESLEKSPTYKIASLAEKAGMQRTANLIKAKNRAAITEIRKGKKSVKDRLDELLKETGEKPKDEEKTESAEETKKPEEDKTAT